MVVCVLKIVTFFLSAQKRRLKAIMQGEKWVSLSPHGTTCGGGGGGDVCVCVISPM